MNVISLLCHTLDFGNEWFGISCSESYWSAVKPIFDRLKAKKGTVVSGRSLATKRAQCTFRC